VRDNRSATSRAWSLAAGIWIEIVVLGIIAVTAQVAAVRSSSQRLLAELQRGLGNVRVVLLSPVLPKPPAPQPVKPAGRVRPAAPKPLAVPDPRLLVRLDPRLQDFVRENPAIESVITREIVRDVDNKTLDVRKLLEKSSLRLAFDVDDTGRVLRRRIQKSSGVPSIDHLALEAAKLLEDYRLLAAFRGVRHIVFSIEVGDRIVLRMAGSVEEPAALAEVKRRLQQTLTLMRLTLAKSEAAFALQDISIEAEDTHIYLTRAFEKQSLVSALMKYTLPEPGR
jgi:TonB family protein